MGTKGLELILWSVEDHISVSITADVTAQADYVISILGKVQLFVKTKLRKRCHIRLIILCCSGMSLRHTTE